MKRQQLLFPRVRFLQAAALFLAAGNLSPAQAVSAQELVALFAPGRHVSMPAGASFLRIEGNFCIVLAAENGQVAALLFSRGNKPGELARQLRERLPGEKAQVWGGVGQDGREWSALVFEEHLPSVEKLSLDELVDHSPAVSFSYCYNRLKACPVGVDGASVTWKLYPREKTSPLLVFSVPERSSPGCFCLVPGKGRTMRKNQARDMLRKLGLSPRAARAKVEDAVSYPLNQGETISSRGDFYALLMPSGELLFGGREKMEEHLTDGAEEALPRVRFNLAWPMPKKEGSEETREKKPSAERPAVDAGMTPTDAFRAYKEYLRGL